MCAAINYAESDLPNRLQAVMGHTCVPACGSNERGHSGGKLQVIVGASLKRHQLPLGPSF